ncbi:FtsB family cell division protein [Sandarakinorhabdus limnophila]|uniref:FtsB family cell division protein n=1 Tax=Sandarakinorhabdus limnophila TaxID=210512 RepID=UPI0026EB84FC|nr:septum formation initiator family protein [Sandarakinorhabdus limnophila]
MKLTLQQMMTRAALPAVCVAVASYFSFHAVSGPTGYVAWREYKVQHSKLQQAVQTSEEQQAALQRRLVLLDPRHVDPDLADELVRRNLDLVKPDEVIVPLPQAQSAGN